MAAAMMTDVAVRKGSAMTGINARTGTNARDRSVMTAADRRSGREWMNAVPAPIMISGAVSACRQSIAATNTWSITGANII